MVPHLHKKIHFKPMGSVQVSLDNPANVYLLTDKNYERYCGSGDFEYFGGKVKESPFWIRAPQEGDWHLVIDTEDSGEPINVAVKITDGYEVYDEPVRRQEREVKEEPVKKAKKSAAKAEPKSKAKGVTRKTLLKELNDKIKKISDDGLIFLLKQAQVLLHNQEVEKLNEMITSKSLFAKKTVKGKASAPKADKAPSGPVDVEEQSGGKSYIITVNGARKILSRAEMEIVLAMCREKVSEAEFCDRFYRWLKTRRNDILFDGRIGNPGSPFLLLIRKTLRAKVKI
jgi:hypothetical protein